MLRNLFILTAGFPALVAGALGGTAAPELAGPGAEIQLPGEGGVSLAPVLTAEDARGRFIVKPNASGLDAARKWLADVIVREETATGELLVRAPEGDDPERWAETVRTSLDVQYVVADEWCDVQDAPNDPLAHRQWHLTALRLPQAWTLAVGNPAVKIAVVDTGIDLTHPELVGVRVLGASAIGSLTWQTGLNDPLISDPSGHGTAVAGVAAAATDNGVGIASVGRGISVLPIKVSNNPGGGALLSDILRGARAGVDAGCPVVSVSYAGVTSSSVQTTGQYITSQGGLLFWAGGNVGATLGSSVNWNDVIIVGATDPDGTLANYSARGVAVDLLAPGTDILSTTSTLVSGGPLYSPATGTSFATPIAAALAALCKSANPQLTGPQIEAALKAGSHPLAAGGLGTLYSHGLIDAFWTISQVLASTAPVALPDAVTLFPGQTALVDVLANDADPQGSQLRLGIGSPLPVGVFDARPVTDSVAGRQLLSVSISAAGLLGTVSVPYTISNALGQVAGGRVSVTVDTAASYTPARTPRKTAQGLLTLFYSLSGLPAPSSVPNVDGLPLAGRSVQPVVDQPATASPAGPLSGSSFAESLRGLLIVPVTGTYTLGLAADDGAALWLDGRPLIVTNSATPFAVAQGTAKLMAGAHDLRIDHYQTDGVWGLELSVSCPQIGLTGLDTVASEWLRREVAIADLGNVAGELEPDGVIDGSDFVTFINAFAIGDPAADIAGGLDDFTPDGTVDGNDFVTFINAFAAGY